MIHFPVGVIEECGEYCPDPHTNHIAIWKVRSVEFTRIVNILALNNGGNNFQLN